LTLKNRFERLDKGNATAESRALSLLKLLSAENLGLPHYKTMKKLLALPVVVALLATPTFTNAQNLHKPTAKHFHPRVEDAGPAQAEPGVPPSDEGLTAGPGISPFLPITPFTVTSPTWTALGPAPIPNGQTIPADANGISLTQAPVSGRLTSIVVDPADPNTVYAGAAQGGVYQSRDGGLTWTPLMDSAQTLAVGSLELDPADATGNTLLVGSGESNFSGDSFAGLGVYKITALKSSPVLSGPFGNNQFVHRGIPGLAIDPNHHDNVYAGSATGQQGIGPQAPTVGTAPPRGLYLSTNFFSGASTFTKIPITGISVIDYRVTSIVYEPGSSDRMFVGVADANVPNTFGGIYFTQNASAPSPTFTKLLATAPADFAPIKFAINKIDDTVTVVAVTGETAPNNKGQGKAYKAVYKSSKPKNLNFTGLPSANGFAAGQGSYNIAVAIDPTNANNIYVTGTLNGTFLRSTNGGGVFTPSNFSLHVDSHAVAVAPSNPSVIYTGNDGGIWRSIDKGLNWIDRNTPTFSATQFQSIAVHPTDPNFSIGGTQDNGTNFFNGTAWTRIDFGDGGYALIDQNPPAPTADDVTMYHTYFDLTGVLIGFGRVLKASCATEGQWSFRGAYTPPIDPTVHCDGTTDVFNGISLNDPVNFYAPMALGPGNPNTVYFGTNKLYRSADKGDTMSVVSQALPSIISAIGISRTNDNVRIVGLNNGKVFATTSGGNPLTDITQTGMPAKYLARAVIDPNNVNTAYVAYNGNAIAHVFKTTNLNVTGTGTVIWTEVDTGIPDVSVNAFVVDQANPTHLYAGTDRGVFLSTNGGTTWSLYGIGLPDVAVFDLAISSDGGHLRAATHGRGFYEIVTAP